MICHCPQLVETTIENIFRKRFRGGIDSFYFERKEIDACASKAGVELSSDLRELLVSFSFTALCRQKSQNVPHMKNRIIRIPSKERFRYALVSKGAVRPTRHLEQRVVPHATPGGIEKYSLSDEQALLAKFRCNRLVDIFTGLTCYSLQHHL